MSVLVPIGDFSRMTHLSVKALRFYHDQGLLEPARIDPSSGYRFYDPGQVPVAQVIRRFRDLDMPLDQVRTVLQASDVETRTKEIIAHLSSMETKLDELQMSVSSLRALLEGPATCALAPDPAVLVAARILQGVGAALMAPNILSILGVVYSGPARVRAISVYGMVMGLAAVSGQLIGGVLIRADLGGLGWRAIFWINVPLGVAALLACRRLVPESRADPHSRFDLSGVALITACLVAVVLPLVDGRQEGWPAWAWIALGSAVPLAVA